MKNILLSLLLITLSLPAWADDTKESAFDRVVRTNTIRCGYGVWAPSIQKDPNTGKLSGIFYDYMEAVGRLTHLKIEWTQEVGWGDFPEALRTGKIDAMCAGMWPKAIEAKDILFTQPTYFLPIYAYVRANDKRFDNALNKINSASIKISVMDSELSSEISQSAFPQAQTVSLTQLSDPSLLLLNVMNGKADVTFTDAWTGAAFMKNNPKKVRIVPMEHPLRLFGHTVALAQGEHSLASIINTATNEMINSGELDKIIYKYSTIPGVLLVKKTEFH